jgi:hypothetical protein
MNFVFGYAGIPEQLFDGIQNRKNNLILGDKNNEVFFAPSLKPSKPNLNKTHITFIQNKFKEKTIEEKKLLTGNNHISNIGFAVIYVRNSDSENFEKEFFPTTLVFSVNWTLRECTKKKELNELKNELFDLLLKATICAKIVLDVIYKEITECRNSTPLLLPIKNFHSKSLKLRLKELQTKLTNHALDKEAITQIMKEIIKLIKKDHPLKNVENKQPCFSDDRGIEFHSPGSALHGIPHPKEGDNHLITCLLGGYRRFGAPFYVAFHYDCKKGEKGNLKGNFHSCHENPKIVEGNPHINISPNDYVRV